MMKIYIVNYVDCKCKLMPVGFKQRLKKDIYLAVDIICWSHKFTRE